MTLELRISNQGLKYLEKLRELDYKNYQVETDLFYINKRSHITATSSFVTLVGVTKYLEELCDLDIKIIKSERT